MQHTNTLTTGKVLPTLLKFAIPVLAAMFLQALYGGADLLIVGQFGTTSDVSGVSTGSMLLHTITNLIIGLTMGITVFVGQKIGEGKNQDAGKAIGTGIVLFTILGIILSILTVIFTKPLALLLHAPQEALTETCHYIRVCGIGIIFIVFYNLLGAIFRGIGDSKTPRITVCIACVINILADLLFVALFKMGSKGAAIATIIAQGISVLISLIIISKQKLPFEFHKNYICLNKFFAFHEIKLGIPIA